MYFIYKVLSFDNFIKFLAILNVQKNLNKWVWVFLYLYFFKKTKNIRNINTFNKPHILSVNSLIISKISAYKNSLFLNKVNNFFYLKVENLNNNILFSNNLNTTPKLSSSSVYKYIGGNYFNEVNLQFLRKNKVYNKGRYSRCRQNYRTGVYICMYLSVVCILGLYYWFFKFSFNFSYLWWFFSGFIFSFFLPKIIKYRLYSLQNIKVKFFRFLNWSSLLLKSIF